MGFSCRTLYNNANLRGIRPHEINLSRDDPPQDHELLCAASCRTPIHGKRWCERTGGNDGFLIDQLEKAK